MSRLIPEHVVEDVRAASDIVQVISDYVALKKKGKYYTGLCPFHHEDTPSFTVTPDKQIFYCFGCNAGGNVFKFVMLKDTLTFPEAVRFLAERTGISMPSPEEKMPSRTQQAREKAYLINHEAKDYWHNLLIQGDAGAEAREYLNKRGLDKAIIEKFQLGYATPEWDGMLNYLSKQSVSSQQAEKIGLALAKERGNGYYDRFRNRVMFPIWNHHGKVVGFGGRVMDNSVPKYLNSPDTELFSKSNTLYGLNFAAKSIRELDQVIVVEGYLDVIRSHQYGITNVVASLGTAMTPEHGKLLMRYTRDVVIAFDADAAGIRAAIRGLEILQELGCRVKVLTIPDGKDPDEFIGKSGAEAFNKLLQTHTKSLIIFKVNQAMVRHDISTVKGKLAVFEEVLPNLARVRNQVEQEEYLSVIGRELNLSWETIKGELGKYRAEQGKKSYPGDKFDKNRHNTYISSTLGENRNSQVKETALERAELTLVWLMVENPGLVTQVKQRLGLEFFRDAELNQLVHLVDQIYQEIGSCKPDQLYNYIDDPVLTAVLSRLLTREMPTDHWEQQLADCLALIEKAGITDRKTLLLKAIAEAEKAGDFQRVIELTTEYKNLL
ncbi:MAG: DNA primase [Thermincolia bacterium]